MPSLDLVYEAAKDSYEMVARWSDSIDTKIIAVFSAASLLIGLLTTLGGVKPELHYAFVIFCLATVSFLATVVFCWKGFSTKTFMMGNNPRKLLEQYAPREPSDAKWYLLKYAGQHYEHNLQVLRQKSSALKKATWFVGGEVLLLLGWLIAT
jgi:hypothetical protein